MSILKKTKKKLIAFAVLILATYTFFPVLGHKCIHDQLNFKPKINTAMERKDLRFLQSTPWTPINIYIDYTYIESQTSVDKKTLAFTKKIVEDSVKIYSTLLSVQRVNPLLRVTECTEIPDNFINPQIKNTGIASDLVIFPYFDLKAEATTEAYAGSCSLDPTTKRPVAGIMAFNPSNFHNDRKNALEYYTLLVLHEINHIMSFSSDLFPEFVDSSYKKLPLQNIVRNATVNGAPKQIIVTPRVVSAARKHFGCNSLEGVELEDQGSTGTAGSHWESRVMLGDFMIGESYDENTISEITLALFEDSGWYKANYYTGGLFRYGKNKGCDFVQKKCINNEQSSFPNEFCVSSGAPMCFASRLAKGFCSLNTGLTVPQPYQYFADKTMGGYTNADFCPVANSGSETNANVLFATSCVYGVQTYPNLGETIGTESACFMSSLLPKSFDNFAELQGKNRAICHSYKCNAADESYIVTVLDKTVTCSKEGGVKSVDGLDGNFICADYNSVCTKTSQCKDAIECVFNKVLYNYPTYDYNNNNSSGDNSAKPISGNHSQFLKGFTFIYFILMVLILTN